MTEQEKKQQRIYDSLHVETKPKIFPIQLKCFLSTGYKAKKIFFLQKKSFLKEKGEWRIEQKNEKAFLLLLLQ